MSRKNEEVELAEEVYKISRASADAELVTMKEKLKLSNELGLIAGRIQAYKSMELLSEYLGYKQLAKIIDNKEFLGIPGITSIDDYLGQLGIGRSTAFNNLKIARTLTLEEVQLLDKVGFTRRDLLGYASLPEDKRLEIKEGKVINLETASREDIRDLIEQVVAETRSVKEETEEALKAKDRVLKGKEALINENERKMVKLERQAREKNLLPEELVVLGRIDELETSLHGYALAAENIFDALQENPFAVGVAAFISLMDNIKMRVSHMREVAVTDLAPSGMLPEEEWGPPPLRKDGD